MTFEGPVFVPYAVGLGTGWMVRAYAEINGKEYVWGDFSFKKYTDEEIAELKISAQAAFDRAKRD